jgi:hypothetical protein
MVIMLLFIVGSMEKCHGDSEKDGWVWDGYIVVILRWKPLSFSGEKKL